MATARRHRRRPDRLLPRRRDRHRGDQDDAAQHQPLRAVRAMHDRVLLRTGQRRQLRVHRGRAQQHRARAADRAECERDAAPRSVPRRQRAAERESNDQRADRDGHVVAADQHERPADRPLHGPDERPHPDRGQRQCLLRRLEVRLRHLHKRDLHRPVRRRHVRLLRQRAQQRQRDRDPRVRQRRRHQPRHRDRSVVPGRTGLRLGRRRQQQWRDPVARRRVPARARLHRARYDVRLQRAAARSDPGAAPDLVADGRLRDAALLLPRVRVGRAEHDREPHRRAPATTTTRAATTRTPRVSDRRGNAGTASPRT